MSSPAKVSSRAMRKEDDTLTSQSLSTYLILAAKGFCMGAANVIPGVSGGTMALILGIYEELINAIRSLNFDFLRLLGSLKVRQAVSSVSWPFLLPVGVGVLLATVSLAKTLSWLLESCPVIVWSFFFGLILSSVLTVSRVIKRWGMPTFGAAAVGAVGAYFLFGLMPGTTPDAPWFIFLSGFLAICAMILPGISGAYVLVLLGKYHYILEAINDKDLWTLLILVAGAVVGLLSFVRAIEWLLKRYHDLTMAILIGLMLGSLRKIWPWKETVSTFLDSHGEEVSTLQANTLPPSLDSEVGAALLLMFLGFVVVFGMDFWTRRRD
jgi:putative membrane protein